MYTQCSSDTIETILWFWLDLIQSTKSSRNNFVGSNLHWLESLFWLVPRSRKKRAIAKAGEKFSSKDNIFFFFFVWVCLGFVGWHVESLRRWCLHSNRFESILGEVWKVFTYENYASKEFLWGPRRWLGRPPEESTFLKRLVEKRRLERRGKKASGVRWRQLSLLKTFISLWALSLSLSFSLSLSLFLSRSKEHVTSAPVKYERELATSLKTREHWLKTGLKSYFF